MQVTDLLVLIPRLAASVIAFYLLRWCPRLFRGRETWVLGRGGWSVVQRWSARLLGVVFLAFGLACLTFAVLWPGPGDPR